MKDLTLDQRENGIPSDGIIVLKNPNKTKHTVMPAMDPKTRWYAGIPRLSDEDKRGLDYYTTPQSRLTLEDGFEIDLSNPTDKANWEWLKHLKEIAPDIEAYKKSPLATFYVYIEGREASVKNKNTEIMFKAKSYIFNDAVGNYEDRALLLGHDLSGETPEVIKEYLLSQTETIKGARRVIAIYESRSLSLQLLYYKAKRKGYIKESEGTIKYGNSILGVNDSQAIAYLQEPGNRDIIAHIDSTLNPDFYERSAEDTEAVKDVNLDEELNLSVGFDKSPATEDRGDETPTKEAAVKKAPAKKAPVKKAPAKKA